MNVYIDDNNHNPNKKKYSNTSLNSLNNNSNNTFDNNINENFFVKDVTKATDEVLKNYHKSKGINQQNKSYISIKKEEENSLHDKTPKNEELIENNIIDKDDNNSIDDNYKNYFHTSQNLLKNDDNKDLDLKELNEFSTLDKSSDINNDEKSYIKYKLINNYKKWNGDNYFIFKGHLIEGPCSFRPTLLTGCALTIPTILFLSFNSHYMKNNITIFVPIIISIIYFISMIFLLIASFIDPGIIRRFNINKNEIPNFPNSGRKDSKIFQLGHLINYKYCCTCGIIRPNRSTHCHDCNNCVERLDHHCPWIGNCAGKRNYKYFFIFLVLLNILCILIFIFCISHIILIVKNKQLNENENEKIKHVTAHSFCEVIISLYLIIYSILTMCFICGLLYYHSKLILTNTTTKEILRKIFNNKIGNPYKRNKSKNIMNVLCPIVKKYNILPILRGEFAEICDKDNNGNTFIINKKKDNPPPIIIENNKQEKIKINFNNNIINDNNDSLPINEEDGYTNNSNSNDYFKKIINIKNNNNNNKKINNNPFNTERFINSFSNLLIKDEKESLNFVSKSVSKQKSIKFKQQKDINELQKKNSYDSIITNDNNKNNNNNELNNSKLENYLKNFGSPNSSTKINGYNEE